MQTGDVVTDVAWVCQHQTIVVALITWFLGVVPVASVAAWYSNKMPLWLQALVHAVMLNLPEIIAALRNMSRTPATQIRKAAAALVLAVGLSSGLTACSVFTGTTLTTLINSTVGQSLVNALLNTLAPSVSAAISKGVAAAGPEIKVMAYALPWAKQAVDFFGPAAGLSALRVAQIDADIVNAEALLANPPTDLASAVTDAVAVWQEVMAGLTPVTVTAPVAFRF